MTATLGGAGSGGARLTVLVLKFSNGRAASSTVPAPAPWRGTILPHIAAEHDRKPVARSKTPPYQSIRYRFRFARRSTAIGTDQSKPPTEVIAE
jgi:hypothetical protein